MIEVFVSRLGRDTASGSFVVILQEKDGDRVLPIWIGQSEAESIASHMQNVTRPRPLTHDLFCTMIIGLGATLRRVTITRVEDRVYYAELYVQRDADLVTIDARPSDSIAIAVRLDAPIFAAESLLLDAAGDDTSDEKSDDEPDILGTSDSEITMTDADAELSSEQLKRYLETLRPEDFGKFKP